MHWIEGAAYGWVVESTRDPSTVSRTVSLPRWCPLVYWSNPRSLSPVAFAGCSVWRGLGGPSRLVRRNGVDPEASGMWLTEVVGDDRDGPTLSTAGVIRG